MRQTQRYLTSQELTEIDRVIAAALADLEASRVILKGSDRYDRIKVQLSRAALQIALEDAWTPETMKSAIVVEVSSVACLKELASRRLL